MSATSNDTRVLQDLQRRLKAQELEIQRLKMNALGATYNRGFLLQTTDPDAVPFRLKVNGRMQGRYTSFFGSGSNQTPRNHFEIERGRLEFQGHMYDPALQFYYNLDADTDDNHDVKFHDFWINYNFDDAFRLYFGKQKVASGETWLQASVNSAYGDSLEYAAGINWFINGTHKHKLTLDVAELDGVPAGNSSPNFETGQVGTLIRLQYQVAF